MLPVNFFLFFSPNDRVDLRFNRFELVPQTKINPSLGLLNIYLGQSEALERDSILTLFNHFFYGQKGRVGIKCVVISYRLDDIDHTKKKKKLFLHTNSHND